MEKIRTQIPNAVSPSRCRMKGERKIPTRILTPRLNQLEPTFLKISVLRIGYWGLRLEQPSRQHGLQSGAGNQSDERFRQMLRRPMGSVYASGEFIEPPAELGRSPVRIRA